MLLQMTILKAVTTQAHCNMPFSSKDKTLIKNLYQFKKYSLPKIVARFSKTNSWREKLACYWQRFKNTKHRPKA